MLFISFRVSYAEVFGTMYAKGDMLLCTIEDDTPVFGKIADILIKTTQECLFVLVPHLGTNYNCHYHSYEVQEVPNEFLVCRQQDFADFHVLSISKSFQRSLSHVNFVCLKYHVTV